MTKTIYSGYTRREDFDTGEGSPPFIYKTYYWTDNKDSLPPDIAGFDSEEIPNFSYVELMKHAMQKEYEGHSINVQVGEKFFYETPEG